MGSSVVAQTSIYGSMAVNGAAFLLSLAPRLAADRTCVTVTHPKVCYYALTGNQSDWKGNSAAMTQRLLRVLDDGVKEGVSTSDGDRVRREQVRERIAKLVETTV